jgi:hypothetical protein
VALKIPCVHDHITELCRKQAEDMHGKYTSNRPELGGAQAEDDSGDTLAVSERLVKVQNSTVFVQPIHLFMYI